MPIPTGPKLWDYAVAELQTELASNISWLTTAFGKAQRMAELGPDGREIRFPGVFAGANNTNSMGSYLNMFPDGHIGNYCWLDVADYQKMQVERELYQELRADIGLIFWLDLRLAYPADYEDRTIEHAKSDVITALRAVRLTRSTLLIEQVAERVENIYRGYTYSEVESQFLMFPFTGFRLDGEMIIREEC